MNIILAFILQTTLLIGFSSPEEYTVWVFLDTECPICQSYTLTLRTLHQEYSSKGILFRGIYTSPTVKRSTIRKFQKNYQLSFPGEIDQDYALARRWDVNVTPEVVLTGSKGEVLYRGAIDNWYYALGKNRPQPTEHYLKDALSAVVSNRPIMTQRTEAIGCLMNL